MSAIEQVIINTIRQLDSRQQQQVLDFLQTLQPPSFDFEQWFKEVRAFRAALREQYGEGYAVGVQSLLDELREEASWPRW